MDLIDRQVAVDAIQQHREDVLGGYEYDEGVAFVYAAAHNHIIDVIKHLPSAQPEPIKVSVDREMTEEELKELKKKIADSPVVLLPSAQPEIIRCGECKHCYIDGENVRFNVCELNHNKAQSDDWFCADAERRTDE